MNARHFNSIVKRMRAVSEKLPDRRTGRNRSYSMADFTLSAFAVFFTQSPSFLSFQQNMEKVQGRNNAQSLFGVERIPCDNQIREMLDPVEPSELFSLFDDLHQGLSEAGLLQEMRSVENTRLVALDGTWFFSSKNIECKNCCCQRHADGTTTHFHSAITPVIVSPRHSHVVPLRPEFIQPQDGTEKQDCEINASKRWLAAHAGRYGTGNDTLLGDDLYAHEPFCRQALLHNFHFVFTCKPTSHAHLAGWIQGLADTGQLEQLKVRVQNKRKHWENHQYRWANQVPLTDGDSPLKVNWCEITVTNDEGKVLYRNAFITDWKIHAENVCGLVAAGRARWKIENENNNTLKTKGYHLEHNFGHGKKHLSSLLLTMNLLAFGLHTLLDVTDASYRLVRTAVGARRKFFQHLEALTAYWFFENWDQLMDFMMRGQEVGPYAPQKI